MSELQVVETGELVEAMTPVEAERITSRIADKLDAIADAHEQVLPLIGEAMTRQAWKALNYQSPQSYVSERFGRALERLNLPVRRAVVAELSEAGMSTREIAPIVGAGNKTVHRDLQRLTVSGDTVPTPAPNTPYPAEPDTTTHGLPKSEHIIDRRGYKHARPTPPPLPPTEGTEPPSEPTKRKRRPITETAHDAGWEASRNAERIERIITDDRFNRNKEEVAAKLRSHLNYAITTYTEILEQLDTERS